MKKQDGKSFAKMAMKNSLKMAMKSGKNPLTGRRYTKKQIKQLQELLKSKDLK
jgi:hypothetical protein